MEIDLDGYGPWNGWMQELRGSASVKGPVLMLVWLDSVRSRAGCFFPRLELHPASQITQFASPPSGLA